jgi:hypothetical protein
MSSEKDPKLDLLERALDACQLHHAELSAQWANLDTKAQGTATVAGVFLAGTLTFVNTLAAGAPPAERFALTTAVILLAACIVCALLALRLRDVDEVAARDVVTNIEELVAACDGDPAERLRDFARDQTTLWLKAIDDVKKVVDEKAAHLRLAQLLLLLVVLCAAAVTSFRIWGHANAT